MPLYEYQCDDHGALNTSTPCQSRVSLVPALLVELVLSASSARLSSNFLTPLRVMRWKEMKEAASLLMW